MGKKNTPEGRVKTAVNKVLDQYQPIYVYMSVPYGYGKSTLDYLVCYRGHFIAIETKAPGETPTSRQNSILREIAGAEGFTLVIDREDGCGELIKLLEHLTYAPSASERSTPADRSAVCGERSEPLPFRKAA